MSGDDAHKDQAQARRDNRIRSGRGRALAVIALLTATVVGLTVAPGPLPAGATGGPKVSLGDVTIVEGNSGRNVVRVPVTLSEQQPAPVTITWTVTGGTATLAKNAGPGVDAKFAGGTLSTSIPAGRLRAGISFEVLGDTTPESAETIEVTALSVSGAGGVTLADAVGTTTIIDDDPVASAAVSVGSATIVEGDSPSATAKVNLAVDIPLTLSAPQASDVVVTWQLTGTTATPNVDYWAGATTKTTRIVAGKTSAQLTVNVYGDLASEATETIAITLTGVTGPAVLGSTTGTITIVDDDTAPTTAAGPLLVYGTQFFAGQLGLGDISNTTVPQPVDPFYFEPAWTSISVGSYHSLAVKADGSLWAWGNNASGQLGLGDNANRSRPDRIGTSTNWTTISAGSSHSLAIKSDGTLWAWGNNASGQLGLGDTMDRSAPTQVGTDTNWSKVTAAQPGDDTLAIKTDGTLWAWGATNASDVPVQVGTDTDWSSVSSGQGHMLAIKTDGTLWAWGNNASGQLGLGDTMDRGAPTQVGTSTWAAVAAGNGFSLGVRGDGTLWAWGSNASGQLGLGDTMDRSAPTQVGTDTNWSKVAAGAEHAYAIRNTGTLWAWGVNWSGALGQGTFDHSLIPVQVGSATDWLAIDAGDYHGSGLRAGGKLWAWGGNWVGQLGVDTGGRLKPTQIGTDTNWIAVTSSDAHSLAIRADGTLWAWGNNASGQLGLGDTTDRDVPTQVGTDTNWAAVSATGGTSVALKTDGTLWAWGNNASGQLGLGDTVNRDLPIQVGTDTNWRSVHPGGNHTVALKTDGTLWAWGNNASGQLGLGDTTDRYAPTPVGTDTWLVATAGSDHTVALRSDGTLWSAGYGYDGQLGIGDISGEPDPIRTSLVQIGTGTTWTYVTANGNQNFALRSDGTAWAWGYNGLNLGVGDTNTHHEPAQVLYGGTIIAVAAGGDNDANWIAASDGSLHALGVTSSPLFNITITPPSTPEQFATLAAPDNGLLIYA